MNQHFAVKGKIHEGYYHVPLYQVINASDTNVRHLVYSVITIAFNLEDLRLDEALW